MIVGSHPFLDESLPGTVMQHIILIVLAWHVVLSSITFAVYWRDKAAARSQRWRTRESTLHALALLGGWPGALLAQRVLRHKSRKTSFLVTFYLMAFASVALEVWFAMADAVSPIAR